MNLEIPKFDPNDIEGSIPSIDGRVVDTLNIYELDEPNDQGTTRRSELTQVYGPEGSNWSVIELYPRKMNESELDEYGRGRKLGRVFVTEAGDEFANTQANQ